MKAFPSASPISALNEALQNIETLMEASGFILEALGSRSFVLDLDTPTNHALEYSAVDICAFDPITGNPLERGGKTIWRVLNLHYHSEYAKKPDSAQEVLGRLFMICMRDRIDVATGDFNRSA